MTTIVDELIYKIGFDVDKDGLSKLDGNLKAITKGALAVAAAASAAAIGIFAITNRVATQLDDMDEFATSIGIATQELQKLQFVGERLGVTNEGMNTSLRFMVKNLAEAADGGGTAVAALEKLGISVEQIKGLAPEQQLKLIATAMENVTDSGQKVSIAMDIFGRSGTSMVTVMKGGAEAIDAVAARMVNLVPQQTIENASKFKDSMQEFNDVIGAIGVTIAGEVMPIFQELIKQFREFFIQNRAIIQMGLRAFFTAIYFVLRSVFEIVKAGVGIFSWFIEALGGTKQIMSLLLAVLVVLSPLILTIAARWAGMMVIMAVSRIFAMINAIKALNIWLRITSLSLKSILIATGIGILLLALQDLFDWVNGSPSLMGLLFGDFATVWPKMKKMFADIKAWVVGLADNAVFRFLAGEGGGGNKTVMGASRSASPAPPTTSRGGRTVNNNVENNNQISVHGVTDPATAAAMVDNHLEKRANAALVTSNTYRR
jgi:hypothetical protein